MPIIDKTIDQTLNYRENPDEIYVVDPLSPLVVLFGPAFSGKTMALIRLTRFLIEKGYRVIPDRSFRPPYYHVYQNVCDSFYPHMCCDGYAARSTSSSEMLLVKVIDRQGRNVCQLLDAPGPYFFDPNEPQVPWRTCINYIRHLRNKRVWLYFVEKGWDSLETRMQYAYRIKHHTYNSFRKDQSVFVFTKVDKTDCLVNMEKVDMSRLYKTINIQYPEIFVPFENNPPLRWFKKYNCQFVPFFSGYFVPSGETGRVDYLQGPDVFPKLLWNAILRSIRR